MKRPNILLLHTDQQRWDALGCSGNPHILTPNLDRLAAGGCLFQHAFCNAPVCMPSRHSLFSGQYPSALGSTCNGIELREETPILPMLLKPYGYATAAFGKLHFRNHAHRDHREPHPRYGFDTLVLSDEPGCYEDAYTAWVRARDPAQVPLCRVRPPPAAPAAAFDVSHLPEGRVVPYVFHGDENLTHTAFVAEETADFIRRAGPGPFFLSAGFFAPHTPLNPPQRFVDLYDADTMPLPIRDPGQDLFDMRAKDFTDGEWRRFKAFYYALVTHIDDQIGRILAALDEAGRREDTLIVFTSDHGEHLGDHGLTGKGYPHWDSSCRIPLILSWPGRLPAGRACPEIVEGVDLVPTLLECAGIQSPPSVQGRSYLPLLAGTPYTPRTSAYCEFRSPSAAAWRSVRTAEFLYAVSRDGRELLYHVPSDPGQLRDVSCEPSYKEDLFRLRGELIRRWSDVERPSLRKTGAY